MGRTVDNMSFFLRKPIHWMNPINEYVYIYIYLLLPDVLSLAITREYKIFQGLDGMCLTIFHVHMYFILNTHKKKVISQLG